MFHHVNAYPGDPILSLFQDFQRDPQARKVNLSIGLFYDENGAIPVLESVRNAAARIAAQRAPHTYLPMEGSAPFREAVQRVVFGEACAAVRERRVATLQTLGGSGALRLGAEFIKRYFPDSAIWISDPSWDNHRVLFAGAQIEVHSYPYYDAASNGIRFDAMLATLETLPARSFVLLQPCCHNPTGLDLTREQWRAVIACMQARGLIPFIDMAYQGFGDGLDDDAWAIRAMSDAGVAFLVSNSFSKNFSLYGERCGGLSVVCSSEQEATHVLTQMQAGVRRAYSSPPLFGAQLVAQVLGDAQLYAQWDAEVAAMRARIKSMRTGLRDRLRDALPGRAFDYLVEQRGMFSYTGLRAHEVDALRERFGVYLLRSGRLCVAGLNAGNLDYVAEAMASVLAPQ
ncbi:MULTISPECIES: amino acid aminotransferase [unclassified Paraburkholderia]|uniref:amino acid aminotransferase n=1 Tax=unclassified Paraburkholderia TaxID=2615204 RepID=UPI002AB048ED|nr:MULTISPECIES: amino acid aminotransferase [unclassified Paraburkholderia]